MAESDPIPFPRQRRRDRPDDAGHLQPDSNLASGSHTSAMQVAFDRRELNVVLRIYGRLVAAGEARDYAIDFGREAASFSIFRRASEVPIWRIEKNPKLARKQGAFSVITATGLILRRGSDLARVVEVLEGRTLKTV